MVRSIHILQNFKPWSFLMVMLGWFGQKIAGNAVWTFLNSNNVPMTEWFNI